LIYVLGTRVDGGVVGGCRGSVGGGHRLELG